MYSNTTYTSLLAALLNKLPFSMFQEGTLGQRAMAKRGTIPKQSNSHMVWHDKIPSVLLKISYI